MAMLHRLPGAGHVAPPERGLLLTLVLLVTCARALTVASECAAACSSPNAAVGFAFYALSGEGAGYGLAICGGSGPVWTAACSDAPASAWIWEGGTSDGPDTIQTPALVSLPYAYVGPGPGQASASLTTPAGTVLQLTDELGPAPADAAAAWQGGVGAGVVLLPTLLLFSRSVAVVKAGTAPGPPPPAACSSSSSSSSSSGGVGVGVGGVGAANGTLCPGFSSRLSLPFLNAAAPSEKTKQDSSLPLESFRWLMPGVFYGDGGVEDGWTPTYAIGGDRSLNSFLAREDRLAAPIALLQGPLAPPPALSAASSSSSSAGRNASILLFVRPKTAVPSTVMADTVSALPVSDARMAFSSLGPERCDNAGRGSNCTALTITFPGCEYDRTYQSGAPGGTGGNAQQLWRFHPLTPGFASNFSLVIGAGVALQPPSPPPSPPASPPPPPSTANFKGSDDEDDDSLFRATLLWTWQSAMAYFSPLLRTDINLTDAQSALLSSLAESFRPTSPIPGVPTGFDKISGASYSTVLELGFVGPQTRMAVALLQAYSGSSSSSPSPFAPNATRAEMGAAIMDAWVAATGPGYGHAVWDTSLNGGAGGWIDDQPGGRGGGTPVVFLRREVVGHFHALEAASLAEEYATSAKETADAQRWAARAASWRAWGMSLADTLVSIQAVNGSWARQYALGPPPPLPKHARGVEPGPMYFQASLTPSEPSTTSTALPIRFLVTAFQLTGNASYASSALLAGEFAWSAYGRRSLYVGAAIDNPDVVDKESCLFAMEGYLALSELTSELTSKFTSAAAAAAAAAAAPAAADSPSPFANASASALWLSRAASAAAVAATWAQITNIPNPVDAPPGRDWDGEHDTSAGLGLIAVGHSGSDTFSSMAVWPFLKICAAVANSSSNGGGDELIFAQAGRLALANTKQPLDLSGRKGYANRGFMSELFSFSVGWDVFSGANDGRGVGDFHFVPWTSANGAYGVAQLCAEGWRPGGGPGEGMGGGGWDWLPEQCRPDPLQLVC